MSILGSLIGPVTGLLDKFIEDKDAKNAIAFQISTMAEKHAQELAEGQLEVNKVEAAHKNMFVAGWRPAVGWVCVAGMAGNFIVIPMANLMGMLGLGAMRTVEKAKGVHREK